MQQRRRYFWIAAIITLVLFVAFIAQENYNFAANIPFLNLLFTSSGLLSLIAFLVLGITIFCLIRLSLQLNAARKAKKLIRQASSSLEKQFWSSDPISQVENTFGKNYENSIIQQRLQLAQKRLAETGGPERALSLMSGQSGIDNSYLQVFYEPTRALIWSLPAFGFMGTAFEMASAVGGLGTALSQTQGYNDLRNLLVNQVVPHLAGAFTITIFALSCSVLCFIFLSVVHAREEAVLLEADTLSLQVLASMQDKQDETLSLTSLSDEFKVLTQQIKKLNSSLTQLQQNGSIGSLIPLLQSADETLKAVREGLEQEMIVTRQRNRNSAMS